MTQKDPLKVKAGLARSKALSSDERKQSASVAAVARWNPGIAKTTHDGALNIGDLIIPCAVLEDGTRVLTQRGMLRALGRNERASGKKGREGDAGMLPDFMRSKAINPYISEELSLAATPIVFAQKGGGKAYGYKAEALPLVCDAYLSAREAGALSASQVHIAKRCEMLVRSLAKVGIIALVDEATGYQEVRDKHALQAILDKYLRKELAAWAKRFPDDFYKEIFRLRDWQWTGIKVQKPQCIGKFTNDIVYDRLAPHILKELELKNPKNENGNRRSKHHQWLTDDVGHPALAQHLFGVIALMRACTTWDQFYRMLQRSLPKKNETLPMDLGTA